VHSTAFQGGGFILDSRIVANIIENYSQLQSCAEDPIPAVVESREP
jgi:hypothetical protein